MRRLGVLLFALATVACTHTVTDYPLDTVVPDGTSESECGNQCQLGDGDPAGEVDAQGKDAEVVPDADWLDVQDSDLAVDADAENVPDGDEVSDVEVEPDSDAHVDIAPETEVVSPLGATWVAWPVSVPGVMTGGDLVLTAMGPAGQAGAVSEGGTLRLGW